MTNQFQEVPDGFILLQRTNGKASHAACMNGRFAGWLMRKHPDGQWVSERKLEPWELMQAEDQRDDGIVHEILATPSPQAQAAVSEQTAAEVRRAALEEAAKLVDTFVSEQMDPERMECGLLIADTIRSLAHQSAADKASEVRAAEVRVMPEVVQSFALEDGRCVMGDPDLAALKDGTYWICKAPIYHAAPSTADSADTGALGEGADVE